MVPAPGAETVGQAKILNAFSKPFELEGLFSAADAGAFGTNAKDGNGGDEVMVDGETYWDADDGIGIDGPGADDGCAELPVVPL
jgi:nuclear GTP-binding protein